MATYVAESDSYAGFGSTGQYFGYIGLAAGTVALTGWAVLHARLPGWRPADASSQLMLVAMEWVGGGLFGLMAVAVLGSLMLSNKSRGTVTVDDLGVTRQIGERSRMLRWSEMEGFVVTPISAGVTLIPREGRRTIVIPRFLDDYRGCIAEIKTRGARLLPPDNLQVRRVLTKYRGWRQALLTYAGVLAITIARDSRETHTMRVMGLVAFLGYFAWVLMTDDPALEDHGWVRWLGGAVVVAILGELVRHMMHTW